MQEIKTYRDLEFEDFDFNGQPMKNTGEYNPGLEDTYYEMEVERLEELLNKLDNTKNQKIIKHKGKLNYYDRKMYWHKNKLLKQIENYMPWYSYIKKQNNNGQTYYKRFYQSNKEDRKIYCRIVRIRLKTSLIKDYNICLTKGMSWKKIYNYKWMIW